MPEYRVLLEGGDVLVVDIHVETAEQAAPVDPTSFGAALLSALGIGLGGNKESEVRVRKAKRPAPPKEPTAEEWLEITSREALRDIRSGR